MKSTNDYLVVQQNTLNYAKANFEIFDVCLILNI